MNRFPPLSYSPRLTPEPPDYAMAHGIYGERLGFEIKPIGAIHLDLPGVYMFCRKSYLGIWSVLYIGETASLKDRLTDRLKTHHKLAEVRAAGATHIATRFVPGPIRNREGMETSLRRAYPTPCNDQ